MNALVTVEFKHNLVNDFFRFLDVSPKTAATYQRALKQLFSFFNEQGIANPAYQDILNFKRALVAKGLKPATINLYIAATRKFFNWTEQAGLYQNVALGVKGAKVQHGHKRDFLNAEGIRQAISTLHNERDIAIFSLVACCGLRTIEVSRANIEDLRTIGGELVLYVQGKGDTEKSNFVKIPEHVAKCINAYLTVRGVGLGSAPLFASRSNNNKGGRLTTTAISGICKNAMRNAGYDSPRLTAHSLRHSAITLAINAGIPLHEVSVFARHSNVATTMIYIHEVNRLKSTCEDSIAGAIWGNLA